MPFDQVHIHGVTLSLLLHSAATTQQDCDGVLFGQVKKKVRSEFRDDDSGLVQIEEVQAYVTSFVCSTSTCTFYDATGTVSEQQLSALEGSDRDPIIGWFTVRPSCGPASQPSMRESAATLSLHRLLDARRASSGAPSQPVLLALVSQREDHNGATITMSYRVFQHVSPMSPGSRHLMLPVELHTFSLARHLGAGGTAPATHLAGEAIMTERACSVCGVPHLPQQKGVGPGSGSAGGMGGGAGPGGLYTDAAGAANMVLASTASASVQQVMQLEEFHQSQLRTLQGVCRLVGEQSAQLRALQVEGEALARQLLELDRPLAG